jgi:hypothetical protein
MAVTLTDSSSKQFFSICRDHGTSVSFSFLSMEDQCMGRSLPPVDSLSLSLSLTLRNKWIQKGFQTVTVTVLELNYNSKNGRSKKIHQSFFNDIETIQPIYWLYENLLFYTTTFSDRA